MELMTDTELVERSRQGDLQAFNHLVSRWEEPIFRFLRRHLGDREEARDLCQETLVKAYVHLGTLRDTGRFKTWLYQIAWNQCVSRVRRRRSRGEISAAPETLEAIALREVPPATARLDEILAARGRQGALRAALQALPEEQRTAILLREYEGLTSEEIGEIAGVSAATVRTRIYYGLRAMRRALRRQGLLEPGLGSETE